MLQKTSSGEMRISVQAIESIVHKSISEYKEIKKKAMAIQPVKDSVVINLSLDLADNINILWRWSPCRSTSPSICGQPPASR